MKLKAIVSILILTGVVSTVNAEVCTQNPGTVTCNKGTVDKLSGEGAVSIKGTTIDGPTAINGMLTAENAGFSSMDVNGTVSLLRCTVNDLTKIKGSLTASSTQFERSIDAYSSSIKLVNSKINSNLQIHKTDNLKQVVYLDKNSEIRGDVIFDSNHGTIYVQGGSKIIGRVIGGDVIED